ncbi:hypothetical protein SALBM311S_03007 [Streptomyces alboniger]
MPRLRSLVRARARFGRGRERGPAHALGGGAGQVQRHHHTAGRQLAETSCAHAVIPPCESSSMSVSIRDPQDAPKHDRRQPARGSPPNTPLTCVHAVYFRTGLLAAGPSPPSAAALANSIQDGVMILTPAARLDVVASPFRRQERDDGPRLFLTEAPEMTSVIASVRCRLKVARRPGCGCPSRAVGPLGASGGSRPARSPAAGAGGGRGLRGDPLPDPGICWYASLLPASHARGSRRQVQ